MTSKKKSLTDMMGVLSTTRVGVPENGEVKGNKTLICVSIFLGLVLVLKKLFKKKDAHR